MATKASNRSTASPTEVAPPTRKLELLRNAWCVQLNTTEVDSIPVAILWYDGKAKEWHGLDLSPEHQGDTPTFGYDSTDHNCVVNNRYALSFNKYIPRRSSQVFEEMCEESGSVAYAFCDLGKFWDDWYAAYKRGGPEKLLDEEEFNDPSDSEATVEEGDDEEEEPDQEGGSPTGYDSHGTKRKLNYPTTSPINQKKPATKRPSLPPKRPSPDNSNKPDQKSPKATLTKAGKRRRKNDDSEEEYLPPSAEKKKTESKKSSKTNRGTKRKNKMANAKMEKAKVCTLS
jgi:hypothetical protein